MEHCLSLGREKKGNKRTKHRPLQSPSTGRPGEKTKSWVICCWRCLCLLESGCEVYIHNFSVGIVLRDRKRRGRKQHKHYNTLLLQKRKEDMDDAHEVPFFPFTRKDARSSVHLQLVFSFNVFFLLIEKRVAVVVVLSPT